MVQVQTSTSDETFRGFLQGAYQAPFIAVDTETNARDLRDGRGYATGLSLAYRMQPGAPAFSDYFPFRHTGDNYPSHYLPQLKRLIEEHPDVTFHNAKHDIESLRTLGIHRSTGIHDTMLMAHLTNENYQSKALDWLGKNLVGQGKEKSEEFLLGLKVFGWEGIPASLVSEYGAADAEVTLALREYLNNDWDLEELEPIWQEQELPFLNLIRRMERRGVKIDSQLCTIMAEQGEEEMDRLRDEIGANPGSPDELAKILIDGLGLPVVRWTSGGKNGTPKPSMDKNAMIEYEAMLAYSDNPLASKILEYRGWQKSVSSNYRPYLELLSPDGRLRPNYKLHGTVTGRMSCEKPNLQQIPRVTDKAWNGSMKKAFIAEEGYTLVEADYSQLEFRLGAAYAKQRELLEIFADDSRDVFTEMAASIGLPRHTVKTMTYTMQYGGGVNRLSNVFHVSKEQATAWRNQYFERYPEIKAITNLAATKCLQQGSIRLWSGRRRHFADPKNESHKAFNAVIQGGAADIVKRTMLRLGEQIDNDDTCRMLLQVHDSVVFEVRDDCKDQVLPEIKSIMESVEPDFGVRFKVDVHEWGE